MFKSLSLKLIALAAVTSAVMFGGASAALASSATGNQNPDLAVAVSLVSSGANPDLATVGDSVAVSGSVQNTTARFQFAAVSVSLTGPNGIRYQLLKVPVLLAPYRTYSVSFTIPVLSFFPLGTYALSISAGNANGVSSAVAGLEIS